MKSICVDASLVMKWLIPESGYEAALAVREVLGQQEVNWIAPSLIDYEIGSALRKKLVLEEIDWGQLETALDLLQELRLERFSMESCLREVFLISQRLKQKMLYDSFYLLLAKKENGLFITADKLFYKAARSDYDFVRFYEEDLRSIFDHVDE